MITKEHPHIPTARIDDEVARRRTFAIISHPDAGKTTLTEKLLLYAGAVALAGAVRARRNQRHVVSDWMTMEQERGISITVTALEMDYQGFRINLLDTPGHQDFSEDTYRTLMAVDSAVMVLDSNKGIEPQTEKLFQVCRMRGIPILTFINKMDHPGRDPLELLDEIERVLGMSAAPLNWPIGTGVSFQGVYDLRGQRVLRFERTPRGQRPAPVAVTGLGDPVLPDVMGDAAYRELREQVELLAGVGNAFNREDFLRGALTPVFFGSALNNFGVEPFLEALLELAPSPLPRLSDSGLIDPTDDSFSGFIFKIQANIDLKHRDRMAFLRICSGRFQRDMEVYHPRLGRHVRLSRAFRLFGREREPIQEAFPGDVIGVVSPGLFALGDTVTAGASLRFPDIPQFPPEHFGVLQNNDISRYKQFHKGLAQVEEEGAVQILYAVESARREPILAVVGELQFDVVLARLRGEYGVDARIERLPYTCARWVAGGQATLDGMRLLRAATLACRDRTDQRILLFTSPWQLEHCQKENPEVHLLDLGLNNRLSQTAHDSDCEVAPTKDALFPALT